MILIASLYYTQKYFATSILLRYWQVDLIDAFAYDWNGYDYNFGVYFFRKFLNSIKYNHFGCGV